jgi:hypothetical protein
MKTKPVRVQNEVQTSEAAKSAKPAKSEKMIIYYLNFVCLKGADFKLKLK